MNPQESRERTTVGALAAVEDELIRQRRTIEAVKKVQKSSETTAFAVSMLSIGLAMASLVYAVNKPEEVVVYFSLMGLAFVLGLAALYAPLVRRIVRRLRRR